MIRVAVIDDLALVRAGFEMLLESAPDIEVVGSAADGAEPSTSSCGPNPTSC